MTITDLKKTDEFAVIETEKCAERFSVNLDRGLDSQEAETRLETFGFNEITEKEESLLHRIARRFWGPIPWMIESAALLSALVQKWEDLAIILTMLFINAGLDFFQESRAHNALKALKANMERKAIVLRNGRFEKIPARCLVPGDVIKLRLGDVVPADAKLFKGDYLLIDQSALTGESLPVEQHNGAVVYANTIVKQGEMLALVVNTGRHTRFANVVSLVAEAQRNERSHFQKMVLQVGNFLILTTIALVLMIVMVSLFRHESLLEIARFALVLTVAAIPVALPAVLSVTMAIGALNLARKKAVVSRLTAIEELAGVDVFCSDKTGTLTENKMQVAEPVTFPGFSEERLFLLATLASSPENDDPLEKPIFQYFKEHYNDAALQEYERLQYIPFDPIRKRTEVTVQHGSETFVAIKGAAQILLQLAQIDEKQHAEINAQIDQFAARGYRTLAVGKQVSGKPLELAGLIPLYDPPRPDSAAVIRQMRDNGVRVKMVTGDHIAIAREIGRLLGLEGEAIHAHQLTGSGSQEILALANALSAAIYHRLHPEVSHEAARDFANQVIDEVKKHFDTRQLDREFIHTHESVIVEMVENVDLFAEVVPEDKYRIVDILQKGGHIVAMTGDGVNDAPALKKADCGFAVANATDAARAAADIILTAPGLSVINDAIREARTTFARMQSYATFRIAETIRIIVFMALSIAVFNFYPITALMIIILALLNDIPILTIATDNTRISNQPVRWNLQELITVALVLGMTGVVSSFLLFYILQNLGYSHELIQSLFFAKLVIAGHNTIYSARTDRWFFQPPYPSRWMLLATFSTQITGLLIAIFGILITPTGWHAAGWMVLYALCWFVFNDALKVATYRMLRKHRVFK